MDALKEKAIADEDGRSAAANKPRTDEGLFTCIVCEAHYEVHHLPDPVTECPVCGYAEKYDSNWGSRKGGA